MSQTDVITPNLSLALPADQSHNVPWGSDVQKLATALTAIDAQLCRYGVDTGSANAFAIALSPAPSLVPGTSFLIKAAHANTGASTLAINGGATHPVTKNGATALAGGEIALGQIFQVAFDGTNFQLVSQ